MHIFYVSVVCGVVCAFACSAPSKTEADAEAVAEGDDAEDGSDVVLVLEALRLAVACWRTAGVGG